MRKAFPGVFLIGLTVSMTGCSTSQSKDASSARTLSSGAQGQFDCADRNDNRFIDQTELIYLRQCGVGENLKCEGVPETATGRPPASDFELGLRMLQVSDVDRDDRISKLEFRAHCSSVGQTE